MAPPRPRLLLGIAVLIGLGASCGRGGGSGTAPLVPSPATTSPTAAGGTTTVVRSAPRWETVTTLTGTGPAEPPAFTILAASIQWRARWTCGTGQLRITTDPAPRRPKPLVDAACPGPGEGFGIASGDIRLKIEAEGPWKVTIDQQVDTPLQEPPFEGMAAAPVLRQGSFYPVEREARGAVRLYKAPDGGMVLRLEDFEVSNNVDLFVWLSQAPSPKTTADAVSAPHRVLGNLRSTVGSQGYALPPDLTIDQVRSVVIWCEPVRIVYGAAALA